MTICSASTHVCTESIWRFMRRRAVVGRSQHASLGITGSDIATTPPPYPPLPHLTVIHIPTSCSLSVWHHPPLRPLPSHFDTLISSSLPPSIPPSLAFYLFVPYFSTARRVSGTNTRTSRKCYIAINTFLLLSLSTCSISILVFLFSAPTVVPFSRALWVLHPVYNCVTCLFNSRD